MTCTKCVDIFLRIFPKDKNYIYPEIPICRFIFHNILILTCNFSRKTCYMHNSLTDIRQSEKVVKKVQMGKTGIDLAEGTGGFLLCQNISFILKYLVLQQKGKKQHRRDFFPTFFIQSNINI